MYISHIAAHAFTYNKLGQLAEWSDPASTIFEFLDDTKVNNFDNVKSWSDSYNQFDNWINLNSVMAMSSNLETYMSTVIQLALESDVGVLFGTSKRIDGIEIVKYGRSQPFDFEDKLVSCVKGDWSSRVCAFSKIFGSVPNILTDNISRLEKIRKLRNNVGHAFGRDIEESRRHNVIDIQSMDRLSRENTLKYQKLIFGVARSLDKQLLQNHIGEYQALHFYHSLRPELNQKAPNDSTKLGNHMMELKKKLGQFGAAKAGKKFCKELIVYYESL